MTAIAFDDIDAINAQASEEYGEWGDELVVTQEMINQFADLTGDHQWIHVDVERCEKESPFGGPIAHGFLTLSLASAMSYDAVKPLEGVVMGVNYGFDKLRFLAPVPAGSQVRGRFKLLELAEKRPGQWQQTNEFTVEIEGEDKPAMIADSVTVSK